MASMPMVDCQFNIKNAMKRVILLDYARHLRVLGKRSTPETLKEYLSKSKLVQRWNKHIDYSTSSTSDNGVYTLFRYG